MTVRWTVRAATDRGPQPESRVLFGAPTKRSSFWMVFFVYPKFDLNLWHRNINSASAVNCFAGLRFRWKIKQAEKRKKHERCDRSKGSIATMFLTDGVIGSSPIWGAMKIQIPNRVSVFFLLFSVWTRRGAVVNDSPADCQSRDWPRPAGRESSPIWGANKKIILLDGLFCLPKIRFEFMTS